MPGEQAIMDSLHESYSGTSKANASVEMLGNTSACRSSLLRTTVREMI